MNSFSIDIFNEPDKKPLSESNNTLPNSSLTLHLIHL